MASIAGVYAREILDSRGFPTVECQMWLDTGQIVVASSPGGTNKSKYEALELRDHDENYMTGLGVTKAVNNINTIIAPQLIGLDPTQQTEIDQLLVNLDGTAEKKSLGANAIMAVSIATLKAGAMSTNLPIYYYLQQKYQLTASFSVPTCVYTMINGGEHGADNLDIQEFEVIPASFVQFPQSLNMAVTIFRRLEQILIQKGAIHSVGVGGGFAPNLFNNTDAFEILIETIRTTPYTFAQDVFLGTDMAAASFFEAGKYALKDKSQAYSPKELIEYYKSMRELYKVFYIEDPFNEDDDQSWQKVTEELGSSTMIVGDSLLATNITRTQKAIKENTCNAILVKPNQTGTVSETVSVVQVAKQAGWQVIVSHRSGETNDDFIADFAVGVGAHYLKAGPPNRGERVAKFNRLLQIYGEIQQIQTSQPNQQTQPDSSSDSSQVASG